MTSSLRYVPGRGGEPVELDGRLTWVQTALGLRGHSWEYDLGRRDVTSQVRKAREVSVEAWWTSLAEADRALALFDADMYAGTPGTLESGGWEQRAYVVASEPSARGRDWMASDLTVLLLDGAWHRLSTTSFTAGSTAWDYGKQYSYGFDYDYGPPEPARMVEVSSDAPCPVRLVVYGRAVDPAITIAGNLYQYDVTVPAGGYLLVDTLSDPVVEVVTADGIHTDAFAQAHRGGGEGSGDYAFQSVPVGTQAVSWDSSFGFDLGLYETKGEIAWSS